MKALIWIFFFTTLIPSIFILPTCLAASDAVDVETTREVVVTPNGQSQVQLGGTVPYSHVITNNSNQTEFIQLAATNSLPGWSVVLGVDTNNDGSYTTLSVLGLQSGQSLNMQATVRAPSNAPIGAVNGTIITITTTDYLSISAVVNQTTAVVVYGVDILDTGEGAALNVNDGGDDDNAANDSQFVDIAAMGVELLFQHVVTNNGSDDDAFNLGATSDATDGFPPGTVFTYWDSTGTVQLTDTDNDGFPDTGILPPGASETIMVKVGLPAGVSGVPTNGYNATLIATSAMDSSATPAADDTALKLGAINPPTVDIANVTADQGATVADGFNDNGVSNAQDEAPVVLAEGAVNSVVTFDLQLANESGSPDSFLLTTGNVPTGWDVAFKNAAVGNVITITPLVPGGGVFSYTAEVTISSNPAEALSNSDQAGAADGYDAVNDSTSALTGIDGDLDYQIDFTATSTSTPGVSDSVTNAVDVEAEREVVISPNGQNQVQPGGTVEYNHKLENNGNQNETVEMDITNSQPGWTTVINVDTDGDGLPDTILTSALAGTTISGVDEAVNPVLIAVIDTDGDGIPDLLLEPGENVNMTTTVTSSSNAALGTVDLSTINVTETTGTPLTSAQDQTTVISGQVRLDKRAAIDTDCNGTPETGFLATQTTQVEPGQCVVWRLTATNEGTATIKNVVISDAAPAFTDVVAGMLKFCHGNACTPAAATDASDADNGTYAAGLVKFFADQLTPGEQMTGEFIVKTVTKTAAGTLIKNLSTVTYENENGNSYAAQSNEAVVTVAPVYSATIENDNELSAAPGQTVYFPHTLSNTGNVADSYDVTADAGDVYLDQNNNGQPDPGEPLVTGPISVPAGEQVNFVVALPIPTDAADGSTHTSELTIVSTNGATVEDVGADIDDTDGTVDNTATVSTGPVLVLNKSSVHDEANNQITYTLTVKNNGGSDAFNVNIVDALPEVDANGVADTQVTLVPSSISANGLINAGDVVPLITISINEAASPLGDINFDGDSVDTLDAIVAKDVTLSANTTVVINYTVQYQPTWPAGDDIDNTFLSFDDPNDDGNPADSTAGSNQGSIVPSNTTNDTIPQIYGVDVADSNTGAAPGVNDGGDDDSSDNDSQFVDAVAAGAEVLFQHVFTNNGNGDDTFNVGTTSDATNGFPPGTVFTYWDSTGTVQLTDTDNDGFPDTGMLTSGASETIMVTAGLPTGVSGAPANGYNATLTATSGMDSGATPAADDTVLKLGAITPPAVDTAGAISSIIFYLLQSENEAGISD